MTIVSVCPVNERTSVKVARFQSFNLPSDPPESELSVCRNGDRFHGRVGCDT